MKTILIFLILLIFYGCGRSGDLDNNLNIVFSKPSSNLIELLKKLREYELIVEDHFRYKIKIRTNNETIKRKKQDIDYVISLTKRYDKWAENWDNRINSIGKELSSSELELIKNAVKNVFNQEIKLNKLISISAHKLDNYPKDSIYLYQYENFLENGEL